MGDRHFVIHGHFYQPPRENPWTETVPVEPDAAPYHDWNARITAESYRPNAHARVMDDQGRVVAVVNNFRLLSFDLGPTLASWLEEHDPHVYSHILEADRRAGTAIAHAYGHAILPLCTERDLRTQVRWGLADFEHRFGRRAEGMWLPECAVDDRTLAVLVEEGVGFTILGTDQAAEPVQPGEVRFWEHPQGRGRIAIVFFDLALSHDVAFGVGRMSAQELVSRAEASAGDGLVLVATDGETFGHHHKFSERTVAYALAVEAPRRGLEVGPLARWLDVHPPTRPVRIRPSSWSCAHGLGRWQRDCGCSTGGQPGWRQHWRAPLREALELLRDHAHAVFERRGRTLLRDPWLARDRYVQVILAPGTTETFLAEHLRPGADPVEALTLLEMERHALLMFTSCGWFFHDLAGLETVQVLRYAARCLDLLRESGDDPPEEAFLDALDRAESNDPEEGRGRQVWARHVEPARVTPQRVVAHLALLGLLDHRWPGRRVGGYEVTLDDHLLQERGSMALATGLVHLVHRRTRRRSSWVAAAVHLGGLDVVGACRPAGDTETDQARMAELRADFARGVGLTRLLHQVVECFGPEEFDMSAALPDEPGRLLDTAVQQLEERFAAVYERLVEDHRPILTALAAVGRSIPSELRAPAQLALSRRVEADFVAVGAHRDTLALRSAEQALAEAREIGISLDVPRVQQAAITALDLLTEQAAGDPQGPDAELALDLLRLCRRFGVNVDIQTPQEHLYRALLRNGVTAGPLVELGEALGLRVDRLGIPR